jgi:hypothetical protein
VDTEGILFDRKRVAVQWYNLPRPAAFRIIPASFVAWSNYAAKAPAPDPRTDPLDKPARRELEREELAQSDFLTTATPPAVSQISIPCDTATSR